MRRKIWQRIAAVVISAAVLQTGIVSYAAPQSVEVTRQEIAASRAIIHAGGWFPREGSDIDWEYSNSRQGLENCIAGHQNIVELDFMKTTDGQLICAHNWGRLFLNGQRVEQPISLQEFQQAKVYDSLSPIWLGDIIAYMRLYPELRIVTDVKADDSNIEICSMIAMYCPDLLDRFIVQIYHEEEYEPIRALGFQNMIFTLYQTGRSERSAEELVRIAGTYPLVGYTFPVEWTEDAAFMQGIKAAGIPLYVHTVNEPEDEQICFANGITAVYTDRVDVR